jgi:hypothetical protein
MGARPLTGSPGARARIFPRTSLPPRHAGEGARAPISGARKSRGALNQTTPSLTVPFVMGARPLTGSAGARARIFPRTSLPPRHAGEGACTPKSGARKSRDALNQTTRSLTVPFVMGARPLTGSAGARARIFPAHRRHGFSQRRKAGSGYQSSWAMYLRTDLMEATA